MSRTKIEQLEFENKHSENFYFVDRKAFCKKCNHQIKSKHDGHAKVCIGKGSQQTMLKGSHLNSYNYSEFCDMGCGQQPKFFHKNGKAYCCKLGAKCPIKVAKDKKLKDGVNPFKSRGMPHPRGGLGKVPWCKGLTKETSEVIAQSAKKSSATHNERYKTYKLVHTDEAKEKIRQDMIARYANGWQSTTCGRAKSYFHSSPIAGDMNLTGSWEITLAKALDKSDIKWSKNKKRFNYIKPDGTEATYLPDFYIDELNLYVEVKGYETDLDKAKWSYFKEPLKVLRKNEIFQIKKWLEGSLKDFNVKSLFYHSSL